MAQYKFTFHHLPVRHVKNWKGELSEIGDREIRCNGMRVALISKEFWEQAKKHRPTWDYLIATIKKQIFGTE